MKKVNLDGKRVPTSNRYYSFREYEGKPFAYQVVFAEFDGEWNEFVIPVVKNKSTAPGARKFVGLYTVEDMIEAASGSMEKIKKIERVHERLVNEYDNPNMSLDNFAGHYGFFPGGEMIGEYNAALEANGRAPINENKLPEKPATIRSLSADPELVEGLARAARPVAPVQAPPAAKEEGPTQ